MAKKSSSHVQNMEYLGPLFLVSNIFGLLEQPGTKSKQFVVYSIAIVSALISAATWSLYKKISFDYQGYAQTTRYIDVIVTVLTTFLNVYCILGSTGKNTDIVNFGNNLKDVDEQLERITKVNFKIRSKMFVYEMIVFILLLVGLFAYEMYVDFVSAGTVDWEHFVIDSVNKYMTTIVILIAYNYIMLVELRFDAINRYFLDNRKKMVTRLDDVKHLSRCHHTLCDSIDNINEYFGFKFFGIILLIALEMIQSVHIILNFVMKKEDLYDENIAMGFVLFLYIYSSLFFLCFGVMISASCEQVIKSSTDTAKICHKLLLNYPITEKLTLSEKNLQEELILLAHQVTQRKPTFTAADFFTIDYNMLYAMFGSIVSYIIIIVQLK